MVQLNGWASDTDGRQDLDERQMMVVSAHVFLHECVSASHGTGSGEAGARSLSPINPQGPHWTEVRLADVLLIYGAGQVLDGLHPLEPTALLIHRWIQWLNPLAKPVLDTHMLLADRAILAQGGRLEWCNQNALRFFGRVAFDDTYNVLAPDGTEAGRVLAAEWAGYVLNGTKRLDGGVGRSEAWAFDDLVLVERASMHQVPGSA